MRADENRPAPSNARRTMMDPLLQIEDRNVLVQLQGGNKKRGGAYTINAWLNVMPNCPLGMATSYRVGRPVSKPTRKAAVDCPC